MVKEQRLSPACLKVSIVSVYLSAAIVRNAVRRFIAIFFIGDRYWKGLRSPSSPADPPKIRRLLVRLPLRVTTGIDRDPLRALYRLSILRHRHRKNAIFESGAHGVLIDISIERDLALEAAIEPLTVSTIAILGLDPLLATHRQQAVLKQHFDVAFLQARKLGRDPILLVGFLDIQARSPTASPKEPRVIKPPEHIIEKPIHLPMQIHHRTDGFRSGCRATLTVAPRPWDKISNIHGRYLLVSNEDPERGPYRGGERTFKAGCGVAALQKHSDG